MLTLPMRTINNSPRRSDVVFGVYKWPALSLAMVYITSAYADEAVKSGPVLQPATSVCQFQRDAFLYPFNSDSIWNVPIRTGAKYQKPLYRNETFMIRDPNPSSDAGRPHAYPWLGRDVLTIYTGTRKDPQIKWTYKGRPQSLPWPFIGGGNSNGGWSFIRTPNDFSGRTTDGWAILFDETHRYYIETWQPVVRRDREGRLNEVDVRFVARNDVCGTGYPNDHRRPWSHEGIRATGMSLLGGLVRKREVADGRIPHAIAMVISQWQLKAGTRATDQVVWPAYHADSNSVSNYKGNIAMGSLFAIPSGINIKEIGIKSAAGLMLARAYQEFGGYVVDTATDTFIIASMETGVPKAIADDIDRDIVAIRNNLTLVSNNAQTAADAGKKEGKPDPQPVGGGGRMMFSR